jgi:prepilin-type N-terminal cleavage/methylation domain-containing protein
MLLNRRRPGFTLIEVVVATAIAGIVGATLMMTLRRQERFYSSASLMLEVRDQLRDGADVLTSDIRGAAVERYGFPLMTDSAVELFSTIGSSVVCETPSGATLFLPPSTLSSGATLTSLLASPDTGDLALIYAMVGGIPDSAQWVEARIAAFATRALATSCPPTTGFTSSSDLAAGQQGYALTLSSIPAMPVRKGAPVRFVRRGRYSLYASGGKWYLGYRRCDALGSSSCGTIQPISGPYLPYVATGSAEPGLAFRYFDANGDEIGDASLSPLTTRIDIVLRGSTALVVALAGDARVPYRDSTVVSVSPRNRAR